MTTEEHLRRASEYRKLASERRQESYLAAYFALLADDHERVASGNHSLPHRPAVKQKLMIGF